MPVSLQATYGKWAVVAWIFLLAAKLTTGSHCITIDCSVRDSLDHEFVIGVLKRATINKIGYTLEKHNRIREGMKSIP